MIEKAVSLDKEGDLEEALSMYRYLQGWFKGVKYSGDLNTKRLNTGFILS